MTLFYLGDHCVSWLRSEVATIMSFISAVCPQFNMCVGHSWSEAF